MLLAVYTSKNVGAFLQDQGVGQNFEDDSQHLSSPLVLESCNGLGQKGPLKVIWSSNEQRQLQQTRLPRDPSNMTFFVFWYKPSTDSLSDSGNLFQSHHPHCKRFFPSTQSDVGEQTKTAYGNSTPKLDDAEQLLLSNFYMLQDDAEASEPPLGFHYHASLHTAGIILVSVQHNLKNIML